MIDIRKLVKVGAHFGHIKSRLHPKMSRYMWGIKNNVYLFNVATTAQLIERAAQFLEKISAQNLTILWVGTKKAAQNAIRSTAENLKMPCVHHRWIGGTLSNFSQVKKSITKLLHFEDILKKSEKVSYYTKKELNTFAKIVERLKKNVSGIRNLTWPIGAIILVDIQKERSVLREAITMEIPVVALVDSNCDPSLVDYIIPTNDDSVGAIKIIIEHLEQAVVRGQKRAKQETEKKKKQQNQQDQEKPKIVAEGEKTTAIKETKKPKELVKKHVDKEKIPVKKITTPEAKPKQSVIKVADKTTAKNTTTSKIETKATQATSTEKAGPEKKKKEKN